MSLRSAPFGDCDDVVNWRDSIRVYREAFKVGGTGDATIKVFIVLETEGLS